MTGYASRARLSAASIAVLMLIPPPAWAQVTRDDVLDALVECRRIADVSARVACYDSNVGKVPPRAEPPVAQRGGMAAATGRNEAAPAPPSPPSAPGRTGAAAPAVAAAARSIEPPPQATRFDARVAAVDERGPGVYLVTLQDGTAWEFAETVPPSYRSPERGATVEIDRGALGGVRLRFDRQQAVRVRQVR